MSEVIEKLKEFVINAIENAQNPDERKILKEKRMKKRKEVAKKYGF